MKLHGWREEDCDIIRALAATKNRIIASIPDNQLLALGSSNTAATNEVARNASAYYRAFLISTISVGDNVPHLCTPLNRTRSFIFMKNPLYLQFVLCNAVRNFKTTWRCSDSSADVAKWDSPTHAHRISATTEDRPSIFTHILFGKVNCYNIFLLTNVTKNN